MNVRITRAEASRLDACHAVFADSALYDHYFTQEGRLDKQLSTAISRGELWVALSLHAPQSRCRKTAVWCET